MSKKSMKKHRKKKGLSPFRRLALILLIFILLLLFLLGIIYIKLGKIKTSDMDESQLVTVNEDQNMQD